jgi:hypothetical protein
MWPYIAHRRGGVLGVFRRFNPLANWPFATDAALLAPVTPPPLLGRGYGVLTVCRRDLRRNKR